MLYATFKTQEIDACGKKEMIVHIESISPG